MLVLEMTAALIGDVSISRHPSGKDQRTREGELNDPLSGESPVLEGRYRPRTTRHADTCPPQAPGQLNITNSKSEVSDKPNGKSTKNPILINNPCIRIFFSFAEK